MSPSDALTPNLLGGWLDYLGIQDCACEWAWRGLGVLYGQSFGQGWVRLKDSPTCPRHGGDTRPERSGHAAHSLNVSSGPSSTGPSGN
jgi:hypothetical protein